MSKHTPEPWESEPYGHFIYAKDAHEPICQFFSKQEDDFENLHANRNRIVQCVNACAGIEDPAQHMAELQSEITRLREALRALLYECTTPNGMDRTGYDFAIMQASEALKGGTNG